MPPDEPSETGSYDIQDVLDHLQGMADEADTEEERKDVKHVKRMLKSLPGSETINKYTSRDIGESFVGALVFSLPLLVEDGVFEIAKWFTSYTVASIPVFFVFNAVFVVAVTAGLLYAIDFREVEIVNPILGFIPRRLVGILLVSFFVSAGSMLMWGRLHADDPTSLELIARVTVIWAAASLGAVLADILPGESKGEDISELVDLPNN